ncbi:MAG TPA: hypothetical protein VIM11_09795 [Tepidisphaeraceae bacterium]
MSRRKYTSLLCCRPHLSISQVKTRSPIHAAGRRYWRDDAIGFDSGLALILLFIWTAICIVSLRGCKRLPERPDEPDRDG